MWFKVDDQIPFNPKVLQAGNKAMGLWVRAGAWSGSMLTDGYIPDDIVTALGGKREDTTRLLQAGLWDREIGGYRFHDWAEYQPSSAKVKQEQAKARKRMRELRANADKNTD